MDGMTINHIVSIDHGSYDIIMCYMNDVRSSWFMMFMLCFNMPVFFDICFWVWGISQFWISLFKSLDKYHYNHQDGWFIIPLKYSYIPLINPSEIGRLICNQLRQLGPHPGMMIPEVEVQKQRCSKGALTHQMWSIRIIYIIINVYTSYNPSISINIQIIVGWILIVLGCPINPQICREVRSMDVRWMPTAWSKAFCCERRGGMARWPCHETGTLW